MKIKFLFIALMIGITSACGVSTIVSTSSINNTSPSSNTNAPGASAATEAISKALGRGVNFGNMLDAPNEGDWRIKIEDNYFTKTKEAGFNNVRLPVRWSNHAEVKAPYVIDPKFAARVDTVVNQGLATGLYLVLDMHHYRQLDGDALDAGDLKVDDAILEERFLAIWGQIASRYKDTSDKLVFEIYNEPHGRQTSEKWNEIAARAVKVIRKTNPTRPIVIGPVQWNSAKELKNLRMPDDANLIATVHNYEPFTFTHQGANWASPSMPTGVSCCSTEQKNQIIAPLETAKLWSEATHYPVYLGEFGAYNKADMNSRVNFSRLMRDETEKRNMSWAYWEMAAGFGVYDPVTKAWRTELINALLEN
jgi:endoglucanase